MSQRNKSCEECGCLCGDCTDQVGLHLHVEIENLKQQLIERENHILKMETNFLKETDKFPNGEVAAISEELLAWQDKYSRLYEAHKRVQRVNQNLEDKLLRIVDKCETEKNALTTEVSNLTRRLVDEKFTVARLQEENERYRNDVNLAIQLLQCKPSNFVSQRYDSLPTEMQQKVRTYLSSKRRQSDGNGNVPPKSEMKTIKVPIPTYPPTAMVYSVNKATLEKEGGGEEKNNSQPVDIVSAAIMGKILEERERERSQAKHCGTCSCPKTKCSKSTQTLSDLNCMEACINAPPKRPTPVCCPMTVRSRTLNNGLELWDKNGGDSNNVAEGILVNIDSGGESSSLNSECSSRQEEDLISFERLERLGGPRHCSVRLQPGSNNILLDNVVDPFTPVLYKGRQASGALVHLPRCTSSSSSSGDEHPVSRRLVPKTETEI